MIAKLKNGFKWCFLENWPLIYWESLRRKPQYGLSQILSLFWGIATGVCNRLEQVIYSTSYEFKTRASFVGTNVAKAIQHRECKRNPCWSIWKNLPQMVYDFYSPFSKPVSGKYKWFIWISFIIKPADTFLFLFPIFSLIERNVLKRPQEAQPVPFL